jgi:hypothetical protein
MVVDLVSELVSLKFRFILMRFVKITGREIKSGSSPSVKRRRNIFIYLIV